MQIFKYVVLVKGNNDKCSLSKINERQCTNITQFIPKVHVPSFVFKPYLLLQFFNYNYNLQLGLRFQIKPFLSL